MDVIRDAMDDILGLTVIRVEPLADFLSSRGIVVTPVDLAFFLYYAIAAVLVIILFMSCCRRSGSKKVSKGSSLLICGPTGVGKTSLFYRLREDGFPRTLMSMVPNEDKIQIGSKQINTIDYPGHQRLRDGLMNTYLQRAGTIVYVVDASNLKEDLSRSAHGLYDILTRSYVSNAGVPVIVACNKADDPTAVNADAARKLLEAELNKLRTSKANNLGLTNVQEQDDSDSVTIGIVGKAFKFDDLENHIDFVSCSCYKGDINALTAVIGDL